MSSAEPISFEQEGSGYVLRFSSYAQVWAIFSALLAAKFPDGPNLNVLLSPHVNGCLDVLTAALVRSGKLPERYLRPEILPPEFFQVAEAIRAGVEDGEITEFASLEDALRLALSPYQLVSLDALLGKD